MLRRIFTVMPFVAATLAQPLWAQTSLDTSAGPVQITRIVGGLEEPWAVAFLPDGDQLVSERGGRLLRIHAGRSHEISGTPQVWAKGQGGLLDILIPKDFATSREVWLSYAAEVEGGAATAIGRGRLSADGQSLEGFEQIWAGDPATGGQHFGARLVEMSDGTLRLGTGDRGTGPAGMEAQDRRLTIGKVMAFSRDGALLTAHGTWAAGIHSLGHRNIQGAAMDRNGALWVVEHGAKGGDELNQVAPALNYGWPVITYGVNYTGLKIGIGTESPGMEQPKRYWDPSMAPSGLAILQDSAWPEWEGSYLVGSLKFNYIARLDPVTFAEEKLQSRETQRVRDVRQGPDGAIWFLSVGQGALYRMAPPSN